MAGALECAEDAFVRSEGQDLACGTERQAFNRLVQLVYAREQLGAFDPEPGRGRAWPADECGEIAARMLPRTAAFDPAGALDPLGRHMIVEGQVIEDVTQPHPGAGEQRAAECPGLHALLQPFLENFPEEGLGVGLNRPAAILVKPVLVHTCRHPSAAWRLQSSRGKSIVFP